MSVSFIVSLFSNRSGNLLNTSHVLIGCCQPIVFCRLLVRISSSNLSWVMVSCLFSRLSRPPFSVCYFHIQHLPEFSPELYFFFVHILVSICYFLYFGWSMILSSGGINDIGDPVSIINSFITPLIFSVVVKCLFVSSIFFISFIWWMLSLDSPDGSSESFGTFSVSLFTFQLLFVFCLHAFA